MPHLTEQTTDAELATCTAGSPCAACRKRSGETVQSRNIQSYASTPPGGWRKRFQPGEDPDATPVFGLELETAIATPDYPTRPPYGDLAAMTAYTVRVNAARNGVLTPDEAAAVAGPQGFWWPKHDGTVTGPELVSHPASLAEWRNVRPRVATMLQTLVHGGVRSWDVPSGQSRPTCGAHISLSAHTFADTDHLVRFADLVYSNPRFWTKVSGRLHEQLNWCRWQGTLADAANRRQWARDLWHYGAASQDRYQVLNAPGHDRVEFRLPRGTLRVDTLYAALEWAASMQEYTRVDGRSLTPTGYVEWLGQHATDYPEITRRLRVLFPARFGEGAASTAAPTTTAARTTSPAMAAERTALGCCTHCGWRTTAGHSASCIYTTATVSGTFAAMGVNA